ncbi:MULTISPECIES: PVC-type heme-binding CxxCH protein [unclassified Imperialibacter]|uniref:PVC-type heme-binding CxxCH protein n=1 Tax=unclassified Imperialibacter TaxID=2629706 RepID=UPI001255A74A|nr:MULTISPECIES: PVC-type heme-binding CxxCH protein [unclassified Imperialibacter]CAD5252030.1 Dehydrogenase [Imperialibacter sp. 75]CAD5298125.1 Dehydrogenase [Imperialibacter sp. 89]VVT13365.1 conserved hypothetical protein [Imperialibacter sp. EC-SDR9]
MKYTIPTLTSARAAIGLLSLVIILFFTSCSNDNGPRRLEILFLGHASEHHPSEKYAPILAQAVAQKGINISYTNDPNDLNATNLAKFDGLILYANHDSITSSQEKALLDFVEGGKGFIPIHCATWCFRNSPKVVNLMGGQFKTHETGTFTADILMPEHPVMQSLSPFETWDETYVHDKLASDNTVLMERVEGDHHEPWTWVRNQGKGRVFYTAYGHDERTWNNPGFQDLVINGIFWAVGDEAAQKAKQYKIARLSYSDAVIPNYEKRDPAPRLQAPLSPDSSMTHIQIPPGFELSLFASEPDIINPIAMAWDEKGRLWVVETVDYPNTVRDEDGVGDDRIKILEDTNGDGKADKFTVFADKLNIPTSIVFVNGGILISQAPLFLFLKDTDGDDKADVREEVMGGWGVSDTHAGPSNLRYGFNNKIWGTVGYSGFEGKIGGEDFEYDQAVFNLSRDFKQMSHHTRTTNNTWGLGFTENNDIFVSTANNTHTAYVNVPYAFTKKVKNFSNDFATKLDGHYAMHPVTKNYRQVDVFGGFTAAAGHNFYTARRFPKEYWNRIAFIAEPTGKLLHKGIFEVDGAGFKESDGWNMMAASDEYMSPVHAEVGPDGDLWVLDWYNFIIQHNPTPSGFENGKGNAHVNPLRDRTHGRIYKISYKGAPEAEKITLDRKEPASLINGLKSSNMFWRLTAQRLIVEEGDQNILPQLYELISSSKEDEIGVNAPAIHAIWAIEGLGALNGTNEEATRIVTNALRNANPGVRKAAIQALPKNAATQESYFNAGSFSDPNLNTRLAAFIEASYMAPSNELGKMFFHASLNQDNVTDQWLSKAVRAGSLAHKNGFIATYLQNTAELAPDGLTEEIYSSTSFTLLNLGGTKYVAAADFPSVVGKEIYLSGNIWKGNTILNGMLIQHGDKTNGYGVFADNDDFVVVVNQNGKTYTGKGTADMPVSFKWEFQLTKAGATFIVNNVPAVSVKTGGLFDKELKQGLRIDKETDGMTGVKSGTIERFTRGIYNLVAEVGGDNNLSASLDADKVIVLKTIPNKMEYDLKTLEVEAGQTVAIIFENVDFMQHNLLIVKPGTLETVGAAADKMAADANGAEKSYIPDVPELLYSTRLVNPGEKVVLTFTAPSEPGDYPYLCTFPGHWRIMNGILKVTNGKSAD